MCKSEVSSILLFLIVGTIAEPHFGHRGWGDEDLRPLHSNPKQPDLSLPSPHRGIYFELPRDTGLHFARRPWEDGYPLQPEDHHDLNHNEEGEEKPFDRGQPEVETSFLMPVYRERRQEEPVAMAARARPREEILVEDKDSVTELYFVAAVAGCSAALAVGAVAAGMCWYKLRRNSKAAAETAYPAYGVTGPSKTPDLSPTGSINGGDRKLAQSAQMYHYQHQKQQMIAMETNGTSERPSASDVESEDEHEEGEYTVYECPGLAPTGEMEVKNPLFEDQPTPMPSEDP